MIHLFAPARPPSIPAKAIDRQRRPNFPNTDAGVNSRRRPCISLLLIVHLLLALFGRGLRA